MITTAEFKKHIAKSFGTVMRSYGFKGSGFDYFQETSDLLIAVYISPSRRGNSCSAGFAVHPKLVDKNSTGKLDFEKLKSHQYEFKMALTDYARGQRWDYSDNETINIDTLDKILNSIKTKAFPVIEDFKNNKLFNKFKLNALTNFHDSWTEKTGVFVMTTDLRFAWVMTLIFERTKPEKAKQFAKWGLSNLGDNKWFGKNDFERVLRTNGA
jgi:hypothetical protein